ncbi:hypothetical protein LF1_58840 [Rubripirellula obstinata]|uniref:Uncharacterized protein n=1 Tax=Rubripirellula obstinata TaxID=406547 RepID=A0A5B1CBY5_9BACT|nr:hypothetical protein LF1_58840 [Rubripirellula obstinata]
MPHCSRVMSCVYSSSVPNPKTADNHGVHTERGLQAYLKSKTYPPRPVTPVVIRLNQLAPQSLQVAARSTTVYS